MSKRRTQRITIDGTRYAIDTDGFVYEVELGHSGLLNLVYDAQIIARVHDELKKRAISNANRRAKHRAMSDLGLVRVKGANGGTYYE